MKTFLFYDLETSGLNKSFNQIFQFAAILTDEKFNTLEEFNVRVKLRPDVIPEPMALVTTRIPFNELYEGISEYEAAKKIHKILNEPGTISLGYNTLGYDDEFLRFVFFRNLLNPYSHQYANNCGRADILSVATVYRLFRENIIQWPLRENKPSLKLDLINDINNLVKGQAHDALVDVKITIELAKKFYTDTELWNYLLKKFDKKSEQEDYKNLPVRIKSDFGEHRLALMIHHKIGAQLNYCTPVLDLGQSEIYKNQNYWLRLENFNSESAQTFSNNPGTAIKKIWGGQEIIIPLVNKTAAVVGNDRIKNVDEIIEKVKSDSEGFKKIISYFRNFRYDEFPGNDIDSALYTLNYFDASFTKQLNEFSAKFHSADLTQKYELYRNCKNPVLKELAGRIIFRNYYFENNPEVVNSSKLFFEELKNKTEQKLVFDHRGEEKNSPGKALEITDSILTNDEFDAQQKQILTDYKNYLFTL